MFPSQGILPVSCPSFAAAFDPKRNAFALLRMVLALFVLVSHCFALGGFGPDPISRITEGQHNLGEIGVALFFLLSGFLIMRSGLRSPSVGRFLWHRFLRVFPGYWICLLVTAFLFSPLFEKIKHGVFSLDASLAYLRGNWAMFHANGWSIAGVMNLRPSTIGWVLNDNPHPWSINGSLWSLPYECGCYLAVAFFALTGILRRGRISILVLFGILWALYAFSGLDPEYFQECFPYRCFQPLVLLTLYFSAGCVCYLYRETIPASKKLFAASLIVFAAGFAFGSFALVAPIALSYVFMCLAFWLPVRNFDGHGDFSYGTYIYAFPIQQGLALAGVQQYGVLVFLLSTLVPTLALAALSYRLVERPSLRFKDIGRRGTNASAAVPEVAIPDSAIALLP